MFKEEKRQPINDSAKIKKLAELDQLIEKKQRENEEIKQELIKYRWQFERVQSKINWVKKSLKKLNKFARALVAYPLGRRNFKQLYSRAYKKKKAENVLKPYIYNLYNLGFFEKAINDLKDMLKETDDRYLRRAIAFELALWHANKYTEDDSYQSLDYLQLAKNGEKDKNQLRKIAILQAECLDDIQQEEMAKQIIQEILNTQNHPDLFLAYANLEKKVEDKLIWINKALKSYHIHPITFANMEQEVTYEDLRTESLNKEIKKGPKVSIILPAYNFETGIQIAIESILSQTWQNIELIVVDDCSTDQTVEVVKAYMDKDDRIKLFSTEQNSGPYIARNIGLQAATGEYVTINDADDWSHDEKIEVQVKHLIDHPEVVANTSEHARLTEDLKFYRRGTRGMYIFSNMSSLMFRRKEVIESIGYWDKVRFAADGEFKRRLIKVFGAKSVVDLKTGPLSLPRQSVHSLTGSSAFGYNGYLMGARKEYVDSLEFYHQQAQSLYYSFSQKVRPFPVPEPMWPIRETNRQGKRHFDVIIASDFRLNKDIQQSTKEAINIHKQLEIKTGIFQLSCYNMSVRKDLLSELREAIDGQDVQMLVYGEKVTCDVLIIKNPSTLQEKQKFIPYIQPKMVVVIIDQLPNKNTYNLRTCSRQVMRYFGKRGKWFAYDHKIREGLLNKCSHEVRYIPLAKETWINKQFETNKIYEARLNEWIVPKDKHLHE